MVTEGPTASQKKMLAVLNLTGYRMYQGTVHPRVIAKRRARNKRARLSRRKNR